MTDCGNMGAMIGIVTLFRLERPWSLAAITIVAAILVNWILRRHTVVAATHCKSLPA
ncbi:hypothetical protein SAMN05660916_03948 [Arthrobacter sp. 31Cvi3.1E]|nr:hypothetical protein [Paenarthrobacter nicotinovorans]SKC02295.1 hypothetical protein SAMN05660916_03948 [Arthrobacter sp. 31Cvi3.1E]